MGNSDDYTNPSKNPDVKTLQATVKDLQSQVMTLSMTVNSLSTMDTVGNVLGQGFKMLEFQLGPQGAIPAQLAELRDIGPKRVEIPQAVAETIATVLDAMKRPVFSGGGLGIPQLNVSFIGQGSTATLPAESAKPFADLMQLLRPGNVYALPPTVSPSQQIVGGEIKP